LVLAIFIDVLELFKGFDDVDVIAKVNNDVFRASMKKIIENCETLAAGRRFG
jgi:hypothetical protein